ncbi:N-acyl homoserine lactonase family protein [Glycomyces tenuis]|uniref:N-acyl homoserine lactonase family protein n=1 Tax=Glycomyces tenuis TaxID=58116 RepID=UPI000402F26F|nr:N-acyl homoserine lactonase family protein [Glycomyces tenuis]
MEPHDPVRRVAVVSTGSVVVRPEHVGPTRKHVLHWLLTSREWTAPRPVNVYVVEHRDGLVLFDTGQDRASVTEPGYFPAGPVGLVYTRIAKSRIGADETLPARLAQLGYRIGDVGKAVVSHLHHDHIGGLRELGHAEILVSEAEWASLAGPLPEARGLLRSRIDLPGLRWNRVEFAPLADPELAPFTTGLDLFGDGALTLLPTPGHTPGSMSMLVRGPGRRPLLMVGDLTCDAELLAAGKLPGVGDRRRLAETVAAVNALRERQPGLTVLAAHDPNASALLEGALDGR